MLLHDKWCSANSWMKWAVHYLNYVLEYMVLIKWVGCVVYF
jgi:hypothetical protein